MASIPIPWSGRQVASGWWWRRRGPRRCSAIPRLPVHPDDDRWKHLIGKQLQLPLCDRTIPIIGDGILVSMEFGTGAVKVTPGHDFSDFETGQRHSCRRSQCSTLPAASTTTHRRASADRRSPRRARGGAGSAAGGASSSRKAAQAEPRRCQRCDTVVEPMLTLQWFVRTEPWPAASRPSKPSSRVARASCPSTTPTITSAGCNIRDWCISRQLWWGHRIPAWYTPAKDGEEQQVFVARTAEEAFAKAGRTDLVQDGDVLDTWFSSALWPFRRWAGRNRPATCARSIPTSVMETGHDILFFWVARMMMMGLHFMNKVPFRVVLLHALVVDENGEKMSKVRGNVLDPLHLVHGADIETVLGVDKSKPTAQKDLQEAFSKFKKAFPSAASAHGQGFPKQGADALRFFPR